MPPKKKVNDKSKNQQQKKKVKDVEDKTFGLKNKNKSKKVQKYVQQVKSQAEDPKKQEALARKRAMEKAAAEQAKREALLMAQTVVQQKCPFGVDPKSILCVLFKDGKCPKGDKCKFSHDMNVGRKSAKRDAYTDARAEKEADKMDSWDNEKLQAVVKSKHGNPRTTTDKICKYFLDAVENSTYGWFWVCPNGGNTCKYRHALPEGYVLKTKEQRRLEKLAEDAAPKITMEEFIELEKSKLSKDLHPITAESFAKWKQEHQLKKKNQREKIVNNKKVKTGREIFKEKYEEVEDDGSHGTEWDMTEFKKQLKSVEDEENIKDWDKLGEEEVKGEGKIEEKKEVESEEEEVRKEEEEKMEVKMEEGMKDEEKKEEEQKDEEQKEEEQKEEEQMEEENGEKSD